MTRRKHEMQWTTTMQLKLTDWTRIQQVDTTMQPRIQWCKLLIRKLQTQIGLDESTNPNFFWISLLLWTVGKGFSSINLSSDTTWCDNRCPNLSMRRITQFGGDDSHMIQLAIVHDQYAGNRWTNSVIVIDLARSTFDLTTEVYSCVQSKNKQEHDR